jgi:TonB-dependent receptor
MYWAADPTVPVAMAQYLQNTGQFPGRASASETGGFFDGPYQEYVNDYDFVDRFYAGYAMTDLKYEDFSLVGGVRYEKDVNEFSAFNMIDSRNPQNQPFTRPVVHPNNEFWLPMVQAKYDAFEWADVRYAYTQTLARPNYDQLSPHYTMSYNLMNVWAGNPNLKTAEAYNHDLIISFHNTKIGLFTIGGFYKTIKLHQIAPAGVDSLGSFTPTPKDGALVYTYMNSPYKATVKGIEVDFQTRLWYLPEPFNGIVLGINYTHIKSEATYPWRDDISFANPNWPTSGPRVIVEVKVSTRSGRLINQPNDILNTYVGYDYKDFAARISFVFQGNAVSYVGAFAEQDGFTRNYFRVDASVRQILPWAKIEVYLDLNNLNNESSTSAQASIGGFTSEQNYGVTANLGVRYRL